MSDFCTIRPASDAVAIELSAWCAALLPTIRHKHNLIIDLCASAVTRRAAGNAMHGANCVLFFGHGTPSSLVGAQFPALIDNLNIGNASGALFIAIACSSASVLGLDAIQQKVESYLGFNGLLAWICGDPDNQFQPATTCGIEKLIHGATIGEAEKEMYIEFGNVVTYYQGLGNSKPNHTLGWLTAFWNQQHLKIHGNTRARL